MPSPVVQFSSQRCLHRRFHTHKLMGMAMVDLALPKGIALRKEAVDGLSEAMDSDVWSVASGDHSDYRR